MNTSSQKKQWNFPTVFLSFLFPAMFCYFWNFFLPKLLATDTICCFLISFNWKVEHIQLLKRPVSLNWSCRKRQFFVYTISFLVKFLGKLSLNLHSWRKVMKHIGNLRLFPPNPYTMLIRFSLKIFWNRRHKNFICIYSRNFIFAKSAIFFRIIAGKREEKFCYSFFFLQARKSFKDMASCWFPPKARNL